MAVFNAGSIVGRMKLDMGGWTGNVKRVLMDTLGVRRALSGVGASARSVRSDMAGLGTSFSGVMSTMAGSAGVGLLAKSFITAAYTAENMNVVLSKTLGSVEEGNKLFSSMAEYASKTPLTFEDTMGGAVALSSVLKGGREQVEAWMPLIGDLSSYTKALGITTQESFTQIIRMISSGAATADLFREKGVLAMLGFQSGVQYTAKETAQHLIEMWKDPQSKFKGMTNALLKTWTGQVSNMVDRWFLFRTAVMQGGAFTELTKALTAVNNYMDGLMKTTKAFLDSNGEAVSRVILTLGGAAVAIGAIALANASIFMLGGTFATLGTIMGGIAAGPASVLAAVLVGGVALIAWKWNEAKEIFSSLKGTMNSVAETLEYHTGLLSKLSGAWKDVTGWVSEVGKWFSLSAAQADRATLAVVGCVAALLTVRTAVALWQTLAWTIGLLVGAISLPVVLVGVLVAALVAGAVLVVTHWEEVKGGVHGVGMAFADMAAASLRAVADMRNAWQQFKIDSIGGLSEFAAKAVRIFGRVISVGTGAANVISAAMSGNIAGAAWALTGIGGVPAQFEAIATSLDSVRSGLDAVKVKEDGVNVGLRAQADLLSLVAKNQLDLAMQDMIAADLRDNPFGANAADAMAGLAMAQDVAATAAAGLGDIAKAGKDAMDVMLSGIGGGADAAAGKAAEKEAKDTAKAFEALKTKGQDLYEQLSAVDGVLAKVTTSIEELKAAGKWTPDAISLLGTEMWKSMDEMSNAASNSLIGRIRSIDSALGDAVTSAKDKASKLASTELLKEVAPPEIKLGSEILTDIEKLRKAGDATQGNVENLLHYKYWDRLLSLSTGVVDAIIAKLNSPELAQAKDNLRIDDSAKRGKGLYDDILGGMATRGKSDNPFGDFISGSALKDAKQDLLDMQAYVNELKAAGTFTGADQNLLSSALWEKFGRLGVDAIQRILSEVKDIDPAARKALEDAAKSAKEIGDEQWAKSSSDLDGVAGKAENITRLIQAVSRLSPEFEKVGQAASFAGNAVKTFISFANFKADPMSAIINGVNLAAEAMGLFGDKAEEVKTGADKVFEEIGNSIEGWVDGFTDAIVEFVKTGKMSFKEFAESVIEDLMKIVIKYAILGPMLRAAGVPVDFMNAKGNVFSGGNILPFARGEVFTAARDGARKVYSPVDNIVPFATGAVVSRPTVFPMAKGKTGLMGEAGPEAIMPLKRLSDGSLGVRAVGGSGGAQVSVQVIDQSTRVVEREYDARVEQGADGKQLVKVLMRDAVRQSLADGSLDRDMASNFGIKRRAR